VLVCECGRKQMKHNALVRTMVPLVGISDSPG
jgi:hypothetical protein